MNKDEIKKEIEKVQKQLQKLQEKLNAKSLSDLDAQRNISAAAEDYRAALAAAGLNDIGDSFGEVAANGKFEDRGIFLTNYFAERDWVWGVMLDDDTNSEVLVRIDKASGKIID